MKLKIAYLEKIGPKNINIKYKKYILEKMILVLSIFHVLIISAHQNTDTSVLTPEEQHRLIVEEHQKLHAKAHQDTVFRNIYISQTKLAKFFAEIRQKHGQKLPSIMG